MLKLAEVDFVTKNLVPVNLALAKAKRVKVEQSIKSVDKTIKNSSAGSSAQNKESARLILVLKQEKTKLQKAKERLEGIELARRGHSPN